MESKKTNSVLIIVVSIILIIVFLLGAYLATDNYLKKLEAEKLEAKESEIDSLMVSTTLDDLKEEYKVVNAIDFNTEITIKLFNNGIFEIETTTPDAIKEHTRGIYKIDDDKLTIKRVLSAIYSDYGIVWVRESSINENIPLSETFVIEGDGAQLNLVNYYLNKNNDPLVLAQNTINEYLNYIRTKTSEDIVNKYESEQLSLIIYKDNVFDIKSDVESYRGTYIVEDGKLIITRMYLLNENYSDASKELKEKQITDTDIFYIEEDGKSIQINDYLPNSNSSLKGQDIKLKLVK